MWKKITSILLLSLIVAVIGVMGTFVFKVVMENFTVNQISVEEHIEDISLETEYEDEHDHEHDQEELSSNNNYKEDESNGSSSIIDVLFEKIGGVATIISFNLIFIALILLYILQGVLQFIRGLLVVSFSKKIDIALSLNYYSHIMDLPMQSISVRKTGEYLARFSDSDDIREAISSATVTLLLDTIMTVGVSVIMFLIEWKMFLVAISIVFVYIIIVILYKKPVEKSSRNAMEKNAALQSVFKENIDGIETIKATISTDFIKEKTVNKYYKFINAVVKNSIIGMSQETIISVVEVVGTVIILWIGFSMVLQSQISIGSLFTFYALLSYFITPVKNLIDLQPTIQKAYVAIDRLNDIVLLDKEEKYEGNKIFDDEIRSIEFKNVSHRYANRELTLNNISFSVKKGEKIAIIGISGSGKTTLAKLLLRLYEFETGDILINGNSIRDYALSTLRKKICYVSQNVFLMSDSIKNNIKLSNSNAIDDEIINVSKKACADDFIRTLPFGYETILEENGMNLSGGQRQKIAIARMLLSNPEVVILDEATSNLDVYSEKTIKKNLMGSKDTVIVITHELKNVKLCDKIVLIENGCVTEIGTHDELIKKNGRYAQMLEEG